MEHPDFYDRNNCIEWAKYILANKESYLILDTETTGLSEKDVIIQIGVVDLEGNVILDSLVKPTQKKSISRDATSIHGIRTKDLASAPTFGDIMLDLQPHIESGRRFLIYNFEFDNRLIAQTFIQDNLYGRPGLKGECIMIQYSKFVGEWNPYYNDYKRQRLPGSRHNATGDCLAALQVIRHMAAAEKIGIPEGYSPERKSFKPEGRKQGAGFASQDQTNSEIKGACTLVFVPIVVFALVIVISTC